MSSPIVTSFNGGELSPLLASRTDIEKYRSGCKTLENMFALTQGGVTRRMGTHLIGEVNFYKPGTLVRNGKQRLITFARSDEISYILEFGDHYFRVYEDGELVLKTSADAYDSTKTYPPGAFCEYDNEIYYCFSPDSGGATSPSSFYWVKQDIYQVYTNFSEDEIGQLKFVQSADTMYIVHENHEVYKLTSTGAAEFTLKRVDFIYEAFEDENIDADKKVGVYSTTFDEPEEWVGGIDYYKGCFVKDGADVYIADRDFTAEEHYGGPSGTYADWTKITYPVTDFTKGTLALMDSDGFDFKEEDVGKYILVKEPREDNSLSQKLNTAGGTTSTMKISGDWNLVTHGTWDGTIELQTSHDGGTTWVMSRTYSATSDRNVDVNGTEEIENVLYRVEMTVHNSGACTVDLNVEDSYYDRIYKIVEFISANTVKVQVKTEIDAPPTTPKMLPSWAMGAWGGDNGYPRSIAFYEERLCFGGNEKKPLTIWTSKTGDYENLTTGVKDTSALIYTLASDKVNKILWMQTHNVLIIATNGDEWALSSNDRDKPLTATNVKAKRQSTYGSEDIQGLLVNNAILFVQRGGRKLREMTYDYQSEVYISPDISVLSEHITESGIKDMAFMQNPYPILWMTRNDGNLLGFTYEKEQKVFAWHKHTFTEAEVKCVAIVPNNEYDELYLILKRNDTTYDKFKYYVERVPKMFIPSTKDDYWFVDGGVKYESGDYAYISTSSVVSKTPFEFNITNHGFVDGDKIMVYPNANEEYEETTFPYMYQVFTVYDVSGNHFKIKNTDGTSAWSWNDHPYDFYKFYFRKVVRKVYIYDNDYMHDIPLSVIADGNYLGEIEEKSGYIELGGYYNTVVVGLHYDSIITPMPIESDLADGGSQARKKRIQQLALRFHKSIGATILTNDGEEMVIPWRDASMSMDKAPEEYSGYKKVKFKDGYDTDASFTVKQDIPYPMTILMAEPWLWAYN